MSASFLAAMAARTNFVTSSTALHLHGNRFDGAVLPGRPAPPSDLDLTGAEAMQLAVNTPSSRVSERTDCDVLLIISSAAGYERRRKAIRQTYLALLRSEPDLGKRIKYRFLLGAPQVGQAEEALESEQEEHGDLLQVSVPESYETLFPKIVASWRWAVSTRKRKKCQQCTKSMRMSTHLLSPFHLGCR